MKILHVVPDLNEPTNGIAVAAKLIAHGQQKDGCEVKLVDTREFVVRRTNALDAYAEIWVHSNWLWSTIRACLTVLKVGVPLVRMTHANLDPLRIRSKGWKKLPIWWLAERWIMNRAARVVVTCDAERRWCEQAGVRGSFEVIDLGRYFDFDHVCRVARCDGGLRVLYLGRVHPLKGVEYLREAVKRTNAADALIQLREVSTHTGKELEADWEWADVLVLPTLSENFGLVVAEALERGRRVITTDGAPAWRTYFEQHPDAGFYLKGYRDGNEETRVKLLADALKWFVD